MQALQEPTRLLGEPDGGTLGAGKQRLAPAPAHTLTVLKRIHLGLDAVAEMDYRVNVGGMTARDARSWMRENQHTGATGLRPE